MINNIKSKTKYKTHIHGFLNYKMYKIKTRLTRDTFENKDYMDIIETYIEYKGREYILYIDVYVCSPTIKSYYLKDSWRTDVYVVGTNDDIDKIVKKECLIL